MRPKLLSSLSGAGVALARAEVHLMKLGLRQFMSHLHRAAHHLTAAAVA